MGKTRSDGGRAQSVLLTPTSTGLEYGHRRAQTIEAVKPRVIESRASSNQKFFNLTGGFQQVFLNDRADQRMVVPVVGYGGHRRGESSQNFFGKSFKETAIQSKFLERQFRHKNA